MEGKRLTLYIDTSVIGGYFDIEFEKETRILFENVKVRNMILCIHLLLRMNF